MNPPTWLDERGRPADEPATLPVYMVFDLLELDGRDLREQPLRERRRLLDRLVSSHGMVFPARRLARNGLKAWQEALARLRGHRGERPRVAARPHTLVAEGETERLSERGTRFLQGVRELATTESFALDE